MDNRIIQYIEDNIEFIDNNKWEEFFSNAPDGVGGVLYEAGIPFLEEMTYVPPHAFSRCEDISNITIPNNIIEIEDRAFYGCVNLTYVHIPDAVENISSHAFTNCINLEEVHLGINTINVDKYAFTYCDSLKKVIIPNPNIEIGDYAFSNSGVIINIEYNGTMEQWNQIALYKAFGEAEVSIQCIDGTIHL